MANGTDSEQQFVLLSGVRTGLKREFAFALKVQSELSGSLGRTRARKFQNSPTANGVSENSSNKRFKNLNAKKELKNDASKPQIEEVLKRDGEQSLTGEEPKVDLVKVASGEETKNVGSEEPNRNLAEPVRLEESKNDGSEKPKSDQAKSANGREKSETVKPMKEEGAWVESPMLIDDGRKTEHALPEKPFRRFTRSTLKSKVKPVEISGTKNGASFASEVVKERKTSELKEEPKVISVKSPSEENNPVTLATPSRETKVEECFEEPNIVLNRPEVGEQLKNDPTRAQTKEATSVDYPVVIDGRSEVQNLSLERPLKRFSRSALKPKVEPMEVSVQSPMVIDGRSEVQNISLERPFRRFSRSALKPKVVPQEVSASASGDSVGPADAKDETSAKGGSVITENAKTAAIVGDECKTTDVVSPLRASPKKKLEMKMSKKIALNKFPSKLRELLDTGMLEGLSVRYLLRGKKGLWGVIKDSGILCSCTSCEGCKVVTPIQFEHHAGSLNKRPADYIYLENGNNLRDVMNACKDSPLDTLEATIQRAIGSSPVKDATVCQREAIVCQNCKRPFTASFPRRSMLLCSSCTEAKECQDSPPCMAGSTSRLSKSDLTPKSSSSALKCISPPNGSKGKITRKDLRLHKLVFEEGGLPEGTEVAYYARGQKLLEGYKKGVGIFCRCCNSVVSASQFEAHAGWASRRKPYLHIYTSNGVSLHELSISLSKDRKFSVKDSDDLCTICADGGDLLLCDGCPRAFHKDCLSLSSVPCGDWYCKYCQNMFQREKFGENNVNARAAGRVSGIDPIEQISQRCIRIVKTSEAEVGGCALCRGHGFSKSGFGPGTVLLCDQCEKEFHVGCLRDHKMADLKELPEGKWFCCTDCNRIHSALQKLLVRGSEKLPDSLSNIIKKKYDEKASDDGDLDVRWRLLSGKIACPETRLFLSKAVAIFQDRFDPIVDAVTGRDLIPSMVYGRNLRGQEFGGMYCAVLTVNSSVVSAGILRIFGTEVAELPLVATNSDKQGQGYFQSLFSCIERLLGFLHVKNLVLPAADEAESIWTKKFGFTKIAPDELSKLRRDCQMMIFQGTSMLQKPVPRCRVVGKSSEDADVKAPAKMDRPPVSLRFRIVGKSSDNADVKASTKMDEPFVGKSDVKVPAKMDEPSVSLGCQNVGKSSEYADVKAPAKMDESSVGESSEDADVKAPAKMDEDEPLVCKSCDNADVKASAKMDEDEPLIGKSCDNADVQAPAKMDEDKPLVGKSRDDAEVKSPTKMDDDEPLIGKSCDIADVEAPAKMDEDEPLTVKSCDDADVEAATKIDEDESLATKSCDAADVKAPAKTDEDKPFVGKSCDDADVKAPTRMDEDEPLVGKSCGDADVKAPAKIDEDEPVIGKSCDDADVKAPPRMDEDEPLVGKSCDDADVVKAPARMDEDEPLVGKSRDDADVVKAPARMDEDEPLVGKSRDDADVVKAPMKMDEDQPFVGKSCEDADVKAPVNMDKPSDSLH